MDLGGGKITLTLDDGNTLELYTKKSKKAKKATDDLSRSEQTLNRNFKGASRQSSNQTKNFSKMAQGITGGLVPAYATLAANIFAIGAAFRFLKDAGDLRILEQGQAEYAQRTGQNLAIMTRQLQAATDGQLAFAEAAQSVAIATAAGLSIKQINELGVVAKNASLMLGRDLTDSFNRLVRGAVKAEPELLDELGIILRLETASEKYALSINKTKNQLNIFEKSQAVVNEVLEQGLEKFGGVETSTNQLGKLAKSFDDLVNSLKRAIGPIAEFMAVAFQQNTLALAGAGAMLGTGVARAIIPTPPKLDIAAAGEAAKEKFGRMYTGKRDLNKLTRSDLKALERDTKRAYDRQTSTVIKFERMKRKEAMQTLKIMKMTVLEEEASRAKGIKGMILRHRLMVLQFQQDNNIIVANAKAAGVALARGFSTALRLVGYAGLIVSAFGIIAQFLDKSTKAEKAYRSAQTEFGRLFEDNAEDMEKMIDGMKTYDSILSNALQSAKALSNVDFSQALKGLQGGLGGADYSGIYKEGSLFAMFQNLVGPMLYGESGKTAILSGSQQQGIAGMLSILRSEAKLLIKDSPAFDQVNRIVDELQTSMAIASNPKRTEGARNDAFDNIIELVNELKEGTIASKNMNNLAMTTQIMTSSVTDFNKALNSFRQPQTPLTRLTSNIKAVGEALEGVAEGFEKGNVALKFDANTGTLVDKATAEAARVMVGAGTVDPLLDKYNNQLKLLAMSRDYYLSIGDQTSADQMIKNITIKGAQGLQELGNLLTAEAERMHKIEMGMIERKTKLQTEYLKKQTSEISIFGLSGSVRAPKIVQKHLKNQEKVAQITSDIADKQTLITELKAKELDKDDAQIAKEESQLANLKVQLTLAERVADVMTDAKDTLVNTFAESMTTAIQGLIEGTTNLKEAFSNITKSILSMMAQLLAKMVALKLLGAMGFNVTGLAKGGIIPMAKGGITGYRSGGVATEPTYLVGEGKHNEAVVPLPDGRSIPVDMKGGGTNNIVVNVTAGGNASSTGNGAQGKALGMLIQASIMETIQREKRPGGVLS